MEWDLPLTQAEEDAMMEVSSDSDHIDDENDDHRRVKRLARNRESARYSRRRKKEKVHLLEGRVAELSAEVNRLRMNAEVSAPTLTDTTMKSSTLALCYRLGAALSNPSISDTDIEALVSEFQTIVGANGSSWGDTLTKTFHQTMDMMIPMHVKFCLWVCGADTSYSQPGPPKWEELVQNTSLTPDQIGKFYEYQGMFGKEKVGLMQAFQDMQTMMERIVQHAKSLNTILVDLKPLLQPRQIGQFALWLQKFCTNQE